MQPKLFDRERASNILDMLLDLREMPEHPAASPPPEVGREVSVSDFLARAISETILWYTPELIIAR